MEKKNPLKNVKVITRPSPPALKILLIVLILLSIAALGALRLVHNSMREEIQALKDEAADFEYANSVLDEKIKDPGSVQSIKDIAKEELGLVDPNTILIEPQS